jgi:hypothetical protein
MRADSSHVGSDNVIERETILHRDVRDEEWAVPDCAPHQEVATLLAQSPPPSRPKRTKPRESQ